VVILFPFGVVIANVVSTVWFSIKFEKGAPAFVLGSFLVSIFVVVTGGCDIASDAGVVICLVWVDGVLAVIFGGIDNEAVGSVFWDEAMGSATDLELVGEFSRIRLLMKIGSSESLDSFLFAGRRGDGFSRSITCEASLGFVAATPPATGPLLCDGPILSSFVL
jgi:hypothetical protein